MKHEYLAEYRYSGGTSTTGTVTDTFARMQLDCQVLAVGDKHAKKTAIKTAREKWQQLYTNGSVNKFLEQQNKLRGVLCDSPFFLQAESLPEHSWHLQFVFKLRKPYMSGDETEFSLFENSVRKEWVFKVPYIAASQWKGTLRSVMMREIVAGLQDGILNEEQFWVRRQCLWRLFGNENDGSGVFLNTVLAKYRSGKEPDDPTQYKQWIESVEKEAAKIGAQFMKELTAKKMCKQDIEGYRGCLYFYPTYFDNIDLEVINPHLRETGAGTQPIYMECVPKDTCGVLTLLCAPLTNSDGTTKREDLRFVANGIWYMMTRYGFGAKTTSGFGAGAILDPNTNTNEKERTSFTSRESFLKFCEADFLGNQSD